MYRSQGLPGARPQQTSRYAFLMLFRSYDKSLQHAPSRIQAIFKRCGPIISAVLHSSNPDIIVRLTYKHEKDAQAAVSKFDGQPADGRTLSVSVVGGVNATLAGRLEKAAIDSDSVDVLMEGDGSSGS